MKRRLLIAVFALAATGSPLTAQIPITLTANLPFSVNNAARQFFRPMFNQMGSSCGPANGIGFLFTYEINRARNLPSTSAVNQYPYCHSYHFLNDGNSNNGTSHMYVDALNIVKENGIPCADDYGGFTNGFPTKWLSGYDLWYKAMQNRVDMIDSFSVADASGLVKLKQWLFDHGNGSSSGGVANFGCSAQGWQLGTIASGVESGKSIMTKYGTLAVGDHAQTACGYNDSIRIDVNRDGKFTNNTDITGDGRVDLADWEIGALYVANSWGATFGNSGFYYCPYRLLALPMEQGGLTNGNKVCVITVKADYRPKLTFAASITHPQRNKIAISVGVAPDLTATTPTMVRAYKHQFNYAGGAYPMCGQNSATTIELGLDLTDLLDSIPGAMQATFFLIVDSRDGAGTVNTLSLMDYRFGSTPVETRSTRTNVPIAARTIVSIASATAVVSGRDNAVGPQRVLVRRVRGIMQVRLLFDHAGTISLVDMRGKIRHFAVSPVNGWSELPPDLAPGIYALNAKSVSGPAWTGVAHLCQ